MNVAIIGTGNIGTDLLVKTIRSEWLTPILFAGRRADSQGLRFASEKGITVSDKGIDAVLDCIEQLDVVFDCTGAESHVRHWQVLKETGVLVIDLTPSNVGTPIIPAVNLESAISAQNINLVTCGGQGGIPIAQALKQAIVDIDYVEIVNTISSNSAGIATRDNLDEYLETTAGAVTRLAGVDNSKAILILNPAVPEINMKTTVFAMSPSVITKKSLERAVLAVKRRVAEVAEYVPGYRLTVEPMMAGNKLVTTIEVGGAGDFLPPYAGNLDIITCAAISVAEFIRKNHKQKRVVNG